MALHVTDCGDELGGDELGGDGDGGGGDADGAPFWHIVWSEGHRPSPLFGGKHFLTPLSSWFFLQSSASSAEAPLRYSSQLHAIARRRRRTGGGDGGAQSCSCPGEDGSLAYHAAHPPATLDASSCVHASEDSYWRSAMSEHSSGTGGEGGGEGGGKGGGGDGGDGERGGGEGGEEGGEQRICSLLWQLYLPSAGSEHSRITPLL